MGDLLDLGALHNIIEKSGSWFSYKGERIGQGRENARQFLKDNKDIAARLEAEVRKAVGLHAQSAAGQAPDGKEVPAPHSKAEPPIKMAAKR
jgi:recombination protein RecA